MERQQNSLPSADDVRQLKRLRRNLKRRLNKITMRLRDSSFTSETDDINFALIEQQIVTSRLERLDSLLWAARASTQQTRLKKD